MGKIHIVMRGLKYDKSTELEANKFFKKRDFGILKKVYVVTTKSGQGGKGGRSDVVFLLISDNIMKFGLSKERFGMGFSWLEDYLVNDRDIIPNEDYLKLNEKIEN